VTCILKTHADIIDQLKSIEADLRDEFAVSQMGLVSSRVIFKPVAAVRLFVVGPDPAAFGSLEAYLAEKLGVAVEVIARANANGAFRYVFTTPSPE
jgi:hypothetical protein